MRHLEHGDLAGRTGPGAPVVDAVVQPAAAGGAAVQHAADAGEGAA